VYIKISLQLNIEVYSKESNREMQQELKNREHKKKQKVLQVSKKV
jgi:hypothetical protein